MNTGSGLAIGITVVFLLATVGSVDAIPGTAERTLIRETYHGNTSIVLDIVTPGDTVLTLKVTNQPTDYFTHANAFFIEKEDGELVQALTFVWTSGWPQVALSGEGSQSVGYNQDPGCHLGLCGDAWVSYSHDLPEAGAYRIVTAIGMDGATTGEFTAEFEGEVAHLQVGESHYAREYDFSGNPGVTVRGPRNLLGASHYDGQTWLHTSSGMVYAAAVGTGSPGDPLFSYDGPATTIEATGALLIAREPAGTHMFGIHNFTSACACTTMASLVVAEVL